MQKGRCHIDPEVPQWTQQRAESQEIQPRSQHHAHGEVEPQLSPGRRAVCSRWNRPLRPDRTARRIRPADAASAAARSAAGRKPVPERRPKGRRRKKARAAGKYKSPFPLTRTGGRRTRRPGAGRPHKRASRSVRPHAARRPPGSACRCAGCCR